MTVPSAAATSTAVSAAVTSTAPSMAAAFSAVVTSTAPVGLAARPDPTPPPVGRACIHPAQVAVVNEVFT
ncbi:hypothetical protein ACWD8I_23190, partial [Micromonospora arida]